MDPLLTAIQQLDYSGTLADVLARLSDETLKGLAGNFNRRDYSAHMLLAVALAAPESRTLDTDIPRLKALVDKTVHLVEIEHMRREGLVEVTFPASIHEDDAPFDLRITEKGKQRLKQMEASL